MNFQQKIRTLALLAGCTLSLSLTAHAAAPMISLFNSKHTNMIAVPMGKIDAIIKSNFQVDQYRNIKVQVIYNAAHSPDHILVYLFSKKYHSVDVAKVKINSQFYGTEVVKNYHLTSHDFAEQPGITAAEAKCPDTTTQFIAFAPNDMDLEQAVTIDVANAAEAHKLKTIRLLKEEATSANYLNYMACPSLIGNFYDGDANPELIVTVDGVISHNEIDSLLRNQFRYKVTNIWLACQAYNDPMKTTMLDTAQSQKYAAGMNNLLVGPSDYAAACTMKAAMDGQPLTASFENCYKNLDIGDDHWGFGGNGSDYFGT